MIWLLALMFWQQQGPVIGVCTSLSNDSLLAANHVLRLEESVSNTFNPRNVSEEKFQQILQKIKTAKTQVLTANVFIPGSIKLVGPALNESIVIGYVDTVMKRASMAGLKIIVLGSGEARRIPAGFDSVQASKQFIGIARKMADVAAKYNMLIAMENLNHTETNMILSFREAVKYAKAINHPHFKLTADIYHMLMENEPAEHLLEGKGLLVNVHIAEKEERAYPGKRGTDFRPYFRAMKEINYSGGIMIECRWGKIEGELPLAVQNLSGQWFK
jgi:sugar phosphate isomerase/epimerase